MTRTDTAGSQQRTAVSLLLGLVKLIILIAFITLCHSSSYQFKHFNLTYSVNRALLLGKTIM